ncbi:MAG TPA: glycosyltransferase family 9 protein [Planctomycetota bacterium]|nr:glycosyltransferase family 9 protein [Planctomycetota bacterium]
MADSIQPLRYPLPVTIPQRIVYRMRRFANRHIRFLLPLLSLLRRRFTVVDHFGTPGDSIMTATICRNLKEKHPGLRLNLITRNASLLTLDPALFSVNDKETFFAIDFEYVALTNRRENQINILEPTMRRLGCGTYSFQARVYLSEEERRAARARLTFTDERPIVSINVKSREDVKDWHVERWRELVARLRENCHVIHLGDDREPEIEGVLRVAGKLNMRESLAMLSCAEVHIGPDSFLAHGASGVGVPSVVIFGGARSAVCVGYRENINLYVQVDCAPCYLHNSRGDQCPHAKKCMDQISVDDVVKAVDSLLARRQRKAAVVA